MKPAFSLIFTSVLLVLATVVALVNGIEGNPQPFVIVYWAVLSIRYIVEIIGFAKERIKRKRVEAFFAKKLNIGKE